jgi:hypothetical protein
MDLEQWLKLHDQWLELQHRAIVQHDEWLERHNRAIAEHDRILVEHDRILEESARASAEHEREMAVQDGRIRRLIRLAVQEARAERRKRREMQRELDEKITQLASAHLLAEEETKALKASLKTYLDSLRRGGNGNQS